MRPTFEAAKRGAARPLIGVIFALVFLHVALFGATFGTVIPIGGHAADIALDEGRGVLYVANFTANRIDVINTVTRKFQSSLSVAAQPASVSLSPNGRYLVVTHFGNFASPNTTSKNVTVMDLESNTKQTLAMAAVPLATAFGVDNRALIVTMEDFVLLDPATGYTQLLDTISGVTAKTLPVPAATFPPQIVRASMAASADGMKIYGTAEAGGEDKALVFSYSVNTKQLYAPIWTASPPLGPRTVSVAQNGSVFMTGWGLFSERGYLIAELRNADGRFNFGSHAIDITRGTVYAQFSPLVQAQQTPVTPAKDSTRQAAIINTAPPVLLVLAADNLAQIERLKLSENLAGKSVLSADGNVMYSVSDSGVMILPVGSLGNMNRVVAKQEDIVFRGSFCDRRGMTQELEIVNPGGGRTDFTLVPAGPGVMVSPASGTTPAKVKISVDPAAFQNQKGTVATLVDIRSSSAVNLPKSVRVLVNNREPDQRGTFVNVPGTLVDVVADSYRNRLYVLRQDTNEVLAFDASTYKQVGTMRTGNTPTQMAMSFDGTYLIVGADDSQIARVYHLDTMTEDRPIVFPGGHYPRSIAAAGGTILAACRVAGPNHTIDHVDIWTRTATELPSLGVYENKVDISTALAASPSGAYIFGAQGDGSAILYDASADTFTIWRKDFEKLSGAFGALSDEFFVADNFLLNASLVPIRQLDSGSGASSGVGLVGGMGLRTMSPGSSSPGVAQRMDLSPDGSLLTRGTRIVEAPPVSQPSDIFGFTRTLAPLPNAIVSLSTSGFTILPPAFDAAVADPSITSVTSAADGSAAVAAGGLVAINGRDLSLVNAATNEVPVPTALADSCLTVNGILVPIIMVSPGQVNAQLPFNVSGTATAILHTPAGVSNSFRFNVGATAPSVFRANTGDIQVATIVREKNNQLVTLSNPIHPEDWIVIYLTGMGQTSPAVDAGQPGPTDTLAQVVAQPSVSIGGTPLKINFAGAAPTQVGVYQINAYVPYWVPLGMEVPLMITQGDSATSLNVRVVK
jgi:uncharacterized protein (TIGR03437 family)